MQLLIIFTFLIVLFFLSKNLFMLIFSMENYKIHKKRLKQLEFKTKKQDESEIQELVDKLTKPVVENIIPKISIGNKKSLEKKLKMSQWDKNMNVSQLVSLKIITKILSFVVMFVLWKASKAIAIVWGLVLFFSIDVLLNNSAKNRREKLMMGFPDFIRITQGYLSANMTFVKSVEESIRFVNKEWQPILRNFVIQSDLSNIEDALDKLKEEVDVFEIKEFVALVRLTLELGSGAKEGFESQAEKIQQLLQDVILLKISKRRMMGILVQGPLLLCNFAILGIPAIHAFTNFNGI